MTVPMIPSFFFFSDNFCAFLECKTFVPFFAKPVSSDENYLVADDPIFGSFYVCDEQFLTITHGTFSNYEFREIQITSTDRGWYADYIWEAKNLNGWKKYFVALKYLVTMPFIKYLQYISPILDSIHNFYTFVNNYLDQCPLFFCYGLLVGIHAKL
jgi:hypothetical protein